VEAALRREMDGRGRAPEAYRHRIPLGLTMLEQGWITQGELRSALAAQRATGSGKLGEWLVRQRSSSEELVTRALGLQWGCPVLSMEFHNPEDLTILLPRLFIDAFGALPLRVAAGRILYLGFEDRIDPALALAAERITGLHVEAGLVQGSLFRTAHARALEARFPSVELIEAATEQALAVALAKALEETRPVEGRLAAHVAWASGRAAAGVRFHSRPDCFNCRTLRPDKFGSHCPRWSNCETEKRALELGPHGSGRSADRKKRGLGNERDSGADR
jgi:hypothetical protein